jgi:hypothetical protein
MIYCYACRHCDWKAQIPLSVQRRYKRGPKCPRCKKHMARDYHAEHASVPRPANWPQWSDNLGVAPNQVGDFRRAYPGVEINPQGQVRVDSLADHRRILKRLGMIDKSAFS